MNEENWPIVENLRKFSASRGRTMVDLAFGWLAAQPLIPSVIAGATRPEQVEQNAKAVEWTLQPDDLAELDRITRRT